MTTLNKPENLKSIEAHDLGQISIKTLRALVQKIGKWQEKIEDDTLFTNAPHDPQYHYLDGKHEALNDVMFFLTSFKAIEPEIREGMADFIGPLRRVYLWCDSYQGNDPRAMTGTENYRTSHYRQDFNFDIGNLDAPTLIAAGSTRESISANDPDRNVFPETIRRDWL